MPRTLKILIAALILLTGCIAVICYQRNREQFDYTENITFYIESYNGSSSHAPYEFALELNQQDAHRLLKQLRDKDLQSRDVIKNWSSPFPHPHPGADYSKPGIFLVAKNDKGQILEAWPLTTEHPFGVYYIDVTEGIDINLGIFIHYGETTIHELYHSFEDYLTEDEKAKILELLENPNAGTSRLPAPAP